MAAESQVEKIIQIGVRHLTVTRPAESEKVLTFSSDTSVDDVADVLRRLPRDNAYYITFDVDCLDPVYLGQTGTPIPGGLSFDQARQLLRATAGLRIVGVDFVELIGAAESIREGAIVVYLLATLLESAMAR